MAERQKSRKDELVELRLRWKIADEEAKRRIAERKSLKDRIEAIVGVGDGAGEEGASK